MPLPAGFTAHLANFTDDVVWSKEPKVNGIWINMFNLNTTQNLNVNDFVITPEMATQGVNRLRPDFLLGRVLDAVGTLRVHAAIEGKKSNGNSFDKIDEQLHDFFTNGQYPQPTWAIGARGTQFKVWWWDGNGGFYGIRLIGGGATSRVPAGPHGQAPQGPTYDLSTIPQAQLQGLLNDVVAFPMVVPP